MRLGEACVIQMLSIKVKAGEETQPQNCRQQNNEDASHCELQNGNEELQHKSGKIKMFEHCHEMEKMSLCHRRWIKYLGRCRFIRSTKMKGVVENGTVQRRPVECSSLFSLKGAEETQHMVAVSEIKLEEGQDVPAKLWKEAHPKMRIHLSQAMDKMPLYCILNAS